MDPEDLIEITFTVEPNCDGWRLDRYLQMKIKRLSRTRIAQVIRQILTMNGQPVRKPGVKVKRGDEILILRPAPQEPEVPRHFTVIAQGPGYLAVDKPAGLPVHPTAHYLKGTLTALIKERYGPDSGINMAHRLDRETSGIVLFGTDREATRRLKNAFRDRRVKKQYLALVHGDLAQRCEVDQPIGPAPGSVIRLRMGVRPDGQPASTEFTPLQRLGEHTLVQATPRTGRQHQIRVHLEHLGLRLVGDKLYGHPDDFFLGLIETGVNAYLASQLIMSRQALHASGLQFPIPDGSGRTAHVEAPLPNDIAEMIERLRIP